MELLLRDKVMELVSSELEALKQKIIENHKEAKQVASGRTIASMKVEVTEDGGILWGRSAFGTLETGRKGGKVPAELRADGLTVSFLNADGNTEKWEFSGSSWAVGGFSQNRICKDKRIRV